MAAQRGGQKGWQSEAGTLAERMLCPDTTGLAENIFIITGITELLWGRDFFRC
jgi:hypothetical protein